MRNRVSYVLTCGLGGVTVPRGSSAADRPCLRSPAVGRCSGAPCPWCSGGAARPSQCGAAWHWVVNRGTGRRAIYLFLCRVILLNFGRTALCCMLASLFDCCSREVAQRVLPKLSSRVIYPTPRHPIHPSHPSFETSVSPVGPALYPGSLCGSWVFQVGE